MACLLFSTRDEIYIQGELKMQNLTMKDRILVIGAGMAWIAGLLIAGSESPYMPWVNLLGALVFLVASLILGKTLPMLESGAKKEPVVKKINTKAPVVQRMRPNSGIRSQYALGVWARG